MAKPAVYYEQAENMYVRQGLSVGTIYKLLKKEVSQKTLYNWKADGNWDTKRAKDQALSQDLRRDLMDVAKALAMELKVNPEPQKIYGLLSLLRAAKLTDDLPENNEPDGGKQPKKQLSPELIARIESEILGM